jgi:hypothetical protein
MGLAFHRPGEIEVGTMAGIGIYATTAARLALDGAFGLRSTAHRFRFRQFSGELAKACRGSWIVQAVTLRRYKPRGELKGRLIAKTPFWRHTPTTDQQQSVLLK